MSADEKSSDGILIKNIINISSCLVEELLLQNAVENDIQHGKSKTKKASTFEC